MVTKDITKEGEKKLGIKIPWFALSVLLFYLVLMLLWNLGVIPHPDKIIDLLEILSDKVGVLGLFIATFLEGLAYIGHEFPGITIIFLSIIISNNNFWDIILIVAIVTLALTVSSLVNYFAGTWFRKKHPPEKISENKKFEKGLLLAALHPAFLSLYFFHSGIKGKNLIKIVYAPMIVFPYGIIIAYVLTNFADFIREKLLSNETFFLTVFLGWFLIELYAKNKKKKNK